MGEMSNLFPKSLKYTYLVQELHCMQYNESDYWHSFVPSV
jgi:hypothetical protein